MPDNIIEKVMQSADIVSESMSDLKDSGTEKIKSMIEEINNSSQLISKGGFNLTALGVSMGLPPEISASFNFIKKISDEEKEILMKESESKTSVTLILNCLFKASDFYDKIKLGNYKLNTVDLSLGLSPGIGIKFKKID